MSRTQSEVSGGATLRNNSTEQKEMVNDCFVFYHITILMPNNPSHDRDSLVSSETPREELGFRASGERASVVVDGSCDEDTQMSDGESRKQPSRCCKNKRKRQKQIVHIGTWNMRTMKELGKLTLLIEELKSLKM